MLEKTKETKERKCADCSLIIPFVKYRTRCISCYKKNKEKINNKKTDINLFINDSDSDSDKSAVGDKYMPLWVKELDN